MENITELRFEATWACLGVDPDISKLVSHHTILSCEYTGGHYV